jgi:hypothetical protein
MSLDLSEKSRARVLVVMTTPKDQANEHVTPAKDETAFAALVFLFL